MYKNQRRELMENHRRNQTTAHYGGLLQTVVELAIRNLPDTRNNRHKPNRTVSRAIILTNGL